jgi:D-glycero-D-manno-heptose 1,7-bisphosphate phosphatase
VTPAHRTAFLDRDGTLNVKAAEGEYVTTAEDLRLLPGAAGAVRRLNSAGVFVVLVTNQRGIARGVLSESAHAEIMRRLAEDLAASGAHLDAVYVCPHEEGCCDCRKPASGLLFRAAREHPDIELGRAVTVGDSESDVLAGSGAGTMTIRISERPVRSQADHVVPDLAAAVPIILCPVGAPSLSTSRRASGG